MDTYKVDPQVIDQIHFGQETQDQKQPGFWRWLIKKIPSRHQILPVFSLIVFIVYTWALYRMAWTMQSWLYSMSVLDILVLAAYVLGFALLESLIVLAFVLLLSLAFPRRLFAQKFVVQGSATVLALTLLAVALQFNQAALSGLSITQVASLPAFFLFGLILFLIFFSIVTDRFQKIAQVISIFAERLTVFSYVYIPLGILSLAVVMIRNVL